MALVGEGEGLRLLLAGGVCPVGLALVGVLAQPALPSCLRSESDSAEALAAMCGAREGRSEREAAC